jgi:hypothetical protein
MFSNKPNRVKLVREQIYDQVNYKIVNEMRVISCEKIDKKIYEQIYFQLSIFMRVQVRSQLCVPVNNCVNYHLHKRHHSEQK